MRIPIHSVFSAVCMTAVLASHTSLAAQSKPFSHVDGSTHWYRAVAVSGGVDWPAANAAAAAAGGYLATISSKQENDFVFAVVRDAKLWSLDGSGPWLGGVSTGSEPQNAIFAWAEPEPFEFTNWGDDQPSDVEGADRIHFGGAKSGGGSTWATTSRATKLPGYVIEFSGASSPRTVGLQQRKPGSFDGYTLLSPWQSKDTFLIDPRGRVVHQWKSAYFPGMSVYLLPNGNLLRCGGVDNVDIAGGGAGGIVEEIDWSGKVVWSFKHSSADYLLHHDIEVMPNGNILMIAWETKSMAEAVAAGRDPELVILEYGMWPDKIIEVKREASGGKIVWEWHAWDHMIQDYAPQLPNFGTVASHPELIDLNYFQDSSPDWLHINAIDYNAKLDQIVLSIHSHSEIWVIDHSTTTDEAASHAGGKSGKGGDILYRWGNPQVYRAGTAKDQQLFHQHDAQWIDASLPGGSNLLIFNNGLDRPVSKYSSVEEIVPPKLDAKGNYPRTGSTWGPSNPVWTYKASTPTDFFSAFISGMQRLPNGNTLICSGTKGRMFEVTKAGETVWEYTSPVIQSGPVLQGDVTTLKSWVFRSPRYAADYPGLKGKKLTPGEPIESYRSALLVDGSAAEHHASIGTTVSLSLRTPYANTGNGKYYQVATSASSGAIPIGHRFARLGVDPLLLTSLSNSAPAVFQGYFGRLDTSGRASARIAIPNSRALVGLDLHTAFVVVDKKAPSGAGLISNTVVVRITPN